MMSNQNLMSVKDQLDGSLTNLFDSLNRPLVHENKFDLTQKINDNFKDILNGFSKEEENKLQSQSQIYAGTPAFGRQSMDLRVPSLGGAPSMPAASGPDTPVMGNQQESQQSLLKN